MLGYHLRPKGPLDSPDEIHGMALEGLVLQHLKAWCDYSDEQLSCYFWRTQGGSEVDFIVYGENHFHALEVKNAKQIQPRSLRPLKTFLKDYRSAHVKNKKYPKNKAATGEPQLNLKTSVEQGVCGEKQGRKTRRRLPVMAVALAKSGNAVLRPWSQCKYV